MSILLVTLGAMVGAPLRYLTDRYVQRRHLSAFPCGTLAVNVAGSLLWGLLFAGARAHGVSPEITILVGTGFCGALTTYSTFSYETARLLQDRRRFHAVANMLVSVLVGLGAAFCGAALAQVIWP